MMISAAEPYGLGDFAFRLRSQKRTLNASRLKFNDKLNCARAGRNTRSKKSEKANIE